VATITSGPPACATAPRSTSGQARSHARAPSASSGGLPSGTERGSRVTSAPVVMI
jgi:hypothetical protein